MKIEIVRQKRKTISLKLVDAERAELKIPLKTTQKEIDKFLDEKKRWIEKNSAKLHSRADFAENFDLLNYIYLDGKVVARASELVLGFDRMSENAKKIAIKKHYLGHFNKIEEMAKSVSMQSGLTYDEIKPITSKKVWGSYNSKRVMKLNWKLVILPDALVYYIICHELSHSIHLNHKPQFWHEVERLCPNYKELKKILENYGFLLSDENI